MEPRAYYNDFDPVACAVLRELIAEGLIPKGDVDGRSITEVQASDLVGYTQIHFFAGYGGWPLALRLAGWPDDRPVLSGSCPCPPFSSAGKKKWCPRCQGRMLIPHPVRTGIFVCCECGHEWLADGRHLWPEMFRLIRDLKPSSIIGEQVGGADGVVWLTGVRSCLEAVGYDVGALDLPACGQGEEVPILLLGEDGLREARVLASTPNIRQRLFWGAVRMDDSDGGRLEGCGRIEVERQSSIHVASPSSIVRVDNSPKPRRTRQPEPFQTGAARDNSRLQEPERRMCACGGLGNSKGDDERRLSESPMHGERGEAGRPGGDDGRMANTERTNDRAEKQCDETMWENSARPASGIGGPDSLYCGVLDTKSRREMSTQQPRQGNGFEPSSIWYDFDIVICRDRTKDGIPKARRIPKVKPGILKCVDGIPYIIPHGSTQGDFEAQCGEESGEVSTYPLSEAEAWKGTRVGLLKLAGNAINPRLGAEFVRCYVNSVEEMQKTLDTESGAVVL